MSGNWDDEEEEVPQPSIAGSTAAPVDPWAGEDAEDDAPASWDEDEVPKEAEKAAPVVKPKALSKRKLEQKMREEEKKAVEEAKRVASDPMLAQQKRLEQLALEEAEAAQQAQELILGKQGLKELEAEEAKRREAIATFPLKIEADYDKFADIVATKAMATKKWTSVIRFLKATLTKTIKDTDMGLEEVNDLRAAFNVIYNAKAEQEKKKKTKGKGKPSVKKQLSVGKASGRETLDFADDNDDYDFI